MRLLSGMRQKILLFSLIISIVPLLCVSYLSFSYGIKIIENQMIDHLVSIADLKKKELQGWVLRQSKSIAQYAATPDVKGLVGDVPIHHNSQNILISLHTHFDCQKAYVTDTEGKIISATRPDQVGTIVGGASITHPLRYSGLHIDDFSITKTGIPIIRFSIPIHNHNDNIVKGVLVLEFNLNTSVFQSVNNWPGMGRTGETLIAKRKGDEILFLNTLRHKDTKTTHLRIPIESDIALPAIFASGGHEGVIRTPDYRGQQVLAVYKYIPLLDWGFVAKIDLQEAFEPIKELRRNLILFTIVLVVMILFIAFYVSNSIINPLKIIEDYSKKLAKGDDQGELIITTGGEIGSLAESIRSMEKDLALYQKELIKNEKLAAIGKLSGSVAHDIRNPLGAISNCVYFLNNFIGKDIENEKIKKHINIIDREIGRANEIISDLMDFSRENTPNLSQGNLNSVLRNLLHEVNVPENISVQKELSSTLPDFKFDHQQMGRVFINLIHNAIQAMPEGGRLEINTTSDSTFAIVNIVDSGSGISSEHIQEIFEPLYTTKSKGVGLGLSISQTFIKKHQGSIDCKSTFEHGTTFTIKLPLQYEGKKT